MTENIKTLYQKKIKKLLYAYICFEYTLKTYSG